MTHSLEGLTSVHEDFTVPSEVFGAERKGKSEAPIIHIWKRGLNKPSQRQETVADDQELLESSEV